MQRLAGAVSHWLLSYLPAIIHCLCHGEEMPSSWKTKVTLLPRDQNSHHLVLQEERSTLIASPNRNFFGMILMAKVVVEEHVAIYLLSFEHVYSRGCDS